LNFVDARPVGTRDGRYPRAVLDLKSDSWGSKSMAKCREITLLSLMRGGDEELAQLRDIFVFVAGIGNFWLAAVSANV